MRAPRVAIAARSVFPLHGYGGLERHVYDLVRHLAREGVAVTLITPPPRPDAAGDGPQDSGARVLHVPYVTFPLAGRRGTTIVDRDTAYPLFGERAGRLAWDLVQSGDIDVVHGLGAAVLGYARRLARARRSPGGGDACAPLVLNPQGLEEFGATDPARARLKRAAYLPLRRAVLACARAADRVIATDRVLKPAVLTHLRVPREKVRLVPNAIDLDALDALASPEAALRVRREAGLEPDDIVLLSVGRLEANKGFGVMIDALAALAAHGVPLSGQWRWILVGDGPNRRALEQAAARAGLGAHVVFAGRLPDADLHAWYEAATLFVHPTLYEGSSLVTLEAMAHRRPIVATRAGGLPDKVRPVNGWLVDPGRPEALAGALSGAIGQPPARLREMGGAGRAIVEREFAWPAVTRLLIDVYRELV